jgi:putative nucleotidyltransferase with HDIG domain
MSRWSGRRPNAAVAVADEQRDARRRRGSSRTRRIDVAALLADVPARQAATSRALLTLDDPNAGARDVAAVLESDPALSTRVLQLANSPLFGAPERVTSVDRAIVVLGDTATRTLVVSGTSGLFGVPDELPAGFWDHSVSVAAGCAVAARVLSASRVEAICAGLMHDIGAVMLFRLDRAGYETRMAAGSEQAGTLLADELEMYGADHAALGADALAVWKIPASIVDALRAHHDDPAQTTNRLARVVIAGEALARAAFDTPTFAHEPARDPAAVFATIGVRVASVDTLIERTAEETNILAPMIRTGT